MPDGEDWHFSLFLQDKVSKYTVKVDDKGKQYDETIEVDTEKQTETFHIPKTASSSAGQVDVVYDFKKVNNMGAVCRLHLRFLFLRTPHACSFNHDLGSFFGYSRTSTNGTSPKWTLSWGPSLP